MQPFSIKLDLLLNDLNVRETVGDLTSIMQKQVILLPSGGLNFEAPTKFLYIKTTSPIQLLIVDATQSNSFTINVRDTCILNSSSFSETLISNPSSIDNAEILVISA